jgi:hypothetical protein
VNEWIWAMRSRWLKRGSRLIEHGLDDVESGDCRAYNWIDSNCNGWGCLSLEFEV